MKQRTPNTRQCAHCCAPAECVKYHSRYSTQDGIRIVYKCWICCKTFCDRYGRAYYDLKRSQEKVTRAVQQVMEGLSSEAAARVEKVHPTTIERWLERAAVQAALADQKIIQQVEAEVIEMDELYSFAGDKQHSPQSVEDETGKHWVHCSMARESRLLMEVEVGPRTTKTAQTLVENTAKRLSESSQPLWCSDGWDCYIEALLSVFSIMLHFIRTRRRGRPRIPRLIPDPKLRYGQLVKHHSGRKLVSITKRVIYGLEELVPLAKISTSLLERLNGTMRQHVSPLHRKTRAFAKKRSTLNLHVQLFKSYYYLCLSHSGLNKLTPAQAARLSDRQWSVEELLSFGASTFSKIN